VSVLQRSITDIIPLALLVIFFGIQQRGRQQVYYRFWFAGWVSVLLSYVLWSTENSGITLYGLVEIARLDLLLLASLLFMTSFLAGVSNLRRIVLTGLPVGLLVVVLLNLQQQHYAVYRPVLLVAVLAWAVYGLYATEKLLPRDSELRTRLIEVVCVVWGVGVAVNVWRTGAPDLSQWVQAEIFLNAAILYGVGNRRRTPAGALATVGFTIWAGFYGWSVWYQNQPMPYLLQMYLNLPKYLVSFAMVLKIFEDAQDEKSALVEQYHTLYDEFRKMYEGHPAATWIFDRKSGQLLSFNPAAVALYGYSREELAAMTEADLSGMDEEDTQLLARLGMGSRDDIQRHRFKDGRKVWVSIVECEVSFQGRESRLLQAHDITDKIESAQLHEHQSGHDVLTGLPNRKLLADRMERALERSVREDKKTAVFAIDIDHFKKVNDTYGHQVGDECLKAVADRLNSKVRSIDTLARTGGEEFVALIGGLASATDAEMIAQDLLQLFGTPLQLPERELAVTVSIGLALFPNDGYDAETLYKRADEALYAAKRNGRNRVEVAGRLRETTAQVQVQKP
jgi:diguanylate cyclase (GGDEF)-like protein/PAS domain S-box-containing protein